MNYRAVLALVLMLSLAVFPAFHLALAAPISGYSEKLDVYTAGSNAYWFATFGGINVTKAQIVAAENVSGISSYSLTAIKTSAASASAQVFWSSGYGIIRFPFLPDEGVFLTINASSASAAQGAMADFNQYLGAGFSQISSNGTLYTYFSPADFALAGQILYELVPVQLKGLAALYAEPNFATLAAPIITLTGVRTNSGFTHSVKIGSMSSGVLTSAGAISLQSVLTGTNASISASPSVNSTQLVVHSLDGIIISSDSSAKIVNHDSNFSGSYSMNVPSGQSLKPNITLVQDTPVLSAYRLVDKGVINSGDLLSVTIIMTDTSQSGTIQNITMNDNWWNNYSSLFQLSAGSSAVNVASLGAGKNISQVYVLKVAASDSHDIILPQSTVSYSFILQGQAFHRTTTLNQVEVRTNSGGPAISIQAGLDIPSGSPIGRAGNYRITVTNNGNEPALNLSVNNSTLQSLAPNGDVWKFSTSLAQPSMVNRNISTPFTVVWTTPDGQKESLASNPASILLSNSGIILPFLQFTLAGTFTPTVLASGSTNVTYTLTNSGTGPATRVSLSQALPAGVSCKSASASQLSCGASGISLSNQSVAANSNLNGTITLIFPRDNFVIPPASLTTSTAGGIVLRSDGGALVVPAGLHASKAFSVNPAFQGMTDTVTIQVSNTGSLPVYNMSVSSSPDVFDAVTGNSNQTQRFFQRLDPKSNQTFNYSVGLITTGNHSVAVVSVTFIFNGFAASYSVPQKNVVVFAPLQVTAVPKPAIPIEGSPFALAVTVTNPSPVNVTNVRLTIPIPTGAQVVNSTGLTIQGGTATLTIPSLSGKGSSVNSLTLKASTGVNLNFNANLTFQYQGQTIKGGNNVPAVTVGVDVLTRYELPVALAILLTLAIAVYIHRKVLSTSPTGASK